MDFETLFYALDLQANLTRILELWIEEKGYAGVLFTLDDLQNLDRASLDLFAPFTLHRKNFQLALSLSIMGSMHSRGFLWMFQCEISSNCVRSAHLECRFGCEIACAGKLRRIRRMARRTNIGYTQNDPTRFGKLDSYGSSDPICG